jgi:hypothetical protein
MNAPVLIAQDSIALPALIERAAAALINAKTSAEVLEARDMASVAYDAAKKAARLMKAKQAHDDLISAAFRAQADALSIEAQAKRRLADEYDAAQERGELATGRDGPGAGVLNGNAKATASDVGLSRKDIHEAREVRDAEVAEPGIVQRTVDEAVAAGEEPTKAKVRRAVKKVATRGKSKKITVPVAKEAVHERERDLRALLAHWRALQSLFDAACASARSEFIETFEFLFDGESAQQKLEAAIKQYKWALDLEFEQRVRSESVKHKAKPQRIALLSDEPCTDCATQQERWHRSLSNMAGEAISLSAYWTQQFGKDWQTFEVTSDVLTLAKQAADAWNDIVENLITRKKHKPSKPPKIDMNVIKQAGAFHTELTNYTEGFCARVKSWHAANQIDGESHGCVVQALEMASMRLQRAAQDIDDR